MNWHTRLPTMMKTIRLRRTGNNASRSGPSSRQLILFYSKMWIPVPDRLSGCSCDCELTTDQSRFEDADAVVFHIPTHYIPTQLPKQPGQIWVALSMESDVNYPRLNDAAYMEQFDLTMTYRLDSDIPTPYLYPGILNDLLTPPRAKTEASPAVFIASNANDQSGRTELVRELMSYIAVDSYGKVLQNRTLEDDRGRQSKLDTFSRYKFTLAFENSISRDYVTEKFFDALIAGSVPVYLGAPNIADFAPDEKSFIKAAAFQSPRELAEYLQFLDQHDDQYREYLAWKERGPSDQFKSFVERFRVEPFCQLCRRICEG